MANTYSFIGKATGTGSSTTMEFTGIPATYTDLIVSVSGRAISTGVTTDIGFRLNGVTTGYNYRQIKGNGSTATSNNSSNTTPYMEDALTRSSATSNVYSSNYFYIPNYTSSNAKSIYGDGVAENGAQASGITVWSCLSPITAAVTSITVFSGTGNFESQSTAYLYGIKNS